MKLSEFFREQESINPLERSQYGEDDALKEILRQMEMNSGLFKDVWVCEFGAGNGKRISNTFQLVKDGANAVYIESNSQRFLELQKTALQFSKIIPLNKTISYHENSDCLLDNVLKETQIPNGFDICSIDVDGFEYQIWKSFKNYNPKIIVIETYPRIKGEYIFQHDNKDKQLYRNSSFLSLLKLGKEKGYVYFGILGVNMFFIRNDLTHRIESMLLSEKELKKDMEKYYG